MRNIPYPGTLSPGTHYPGTHYPGTQEVGGDREFVRIIESPDNRGSDNQGCTELEQIRKIAGNVSEDVSSNSS